MTPLAHRLANQLTLPMKKREPFWQGIGSKILARALDDIHCFEISQILPMVNELAKQLIDMDSDGAERVFEKLAFLPAPKTWIEFKRLDNSRIAFLLTDRNDGWAEVDVFFGGEESAGGIVGKVCLTSQTHTRYGYKIASPDQFRTTDNDTQQVSEWLSIPHIVLPVINTPRIIGRKQHMPNRGLERHLTKTMGRGKFPLNAWTEIELKVSKPIEIDDGEPHEAHLTGRRALHFCRAHLRIRLGRLEYVTSHWRGDPAIGIKQSRYKLVA